MLRHYNVRVSALLTNQLLFRRRTMLYTRLAVCGLTKTSRDAGTTPGQPVSHQVDRRDGLGAIKTAWFTMNLQI